MPYAIVFPQRKRDPARGNEDRADDVTALQRGAHKGFYCFEWEKLWHPDIADPEVAIADYARVVGQMLGKRPCVRPGLANKTPPIHESARCQKSFRSSHPRKPFCPTNKTAPP